MPSLLVYPQKRPLVGAITVPGDKSISHRAVMLAALASGTSQVRNWLAAGDTFSTLEAIRALGVRVDIKQRTSAAWDLQVEGRGLYGLIQPGQPLNCRNAGTCMRLLTGILAGQRFSSTVDGSEQLRNRPMRRIVVPLRLMGARIESEGGRAPLRIQPGRLQGIDYKMPVASAQVKSAILLASLYAQGNTRLIQPGPTRDHTERLLQAMGVRVAVEGNSIQLEKHAVDGQEMTLLPLDLVVPGDLSSAAFILVAAAIVPHSRVSVRDVGCNETRLGLLDALGAMGADLEIHDRRTNGGEPTAEIMSSFGELHRTELGGEMVVRAIDEIPVWAVAATQALGWSEVKNAAELRVKEVDRIAVLALELGKMGAELVENQDGFSIYGPTRLQGARVDTHGDHRLGMALAVAGMVAQGPTLITNANCISDSFPDFVTSMQSIGARMEWRDEPDSRAS